MGPETSGPFHMGLSLNCLALLVAWWLHFKSKYPKRTWLKQYHIHDLTSEVKMSHFYQNKQPIQIQRIHGTNISNQEVSNSCCNKTMWSGRYLGNHFGKYNVTVCFLIIKPSIPPISKILFSPFLRHIPLEHHQLEVHNLLPQSGLGVDEAFG